MCSPCSRCLASCRYRCPTGSAAQQAMNRLRNLQSARPALCAPRLWHASALHAEEEERKGMQAMNWAPHEPADACLFLPGRQILVRLLFSSHSPHSEQLPPHLCSAQAGRACRLAPWHQRTCQAGSPDCCDAQPGRQQRFPACQQQQWSRQQSWGAGLAGGQMRLRHLAGET